MSQYWCRRWPWPKRHRFRLVEFPHPESDHWRAKGRICTRCGRLWVSDYLTIFGTWPHGFHAANPTERRAYHNASANEVLTSGIEGLP